jgi:hypothetical protein
MRECKPGVRENKVDRQRTKVILQTFWQSNELFVPNTNCGAEQHNTLLSTTVHTFKHSGGCIMFMGMLVKDWGVF